MPPSNDDLASATVLHGISGSVTFSNIGATRQTDELSFGGDSSLGTVWFTYTPASSGDLTFSTQSTPLPSWDSWLDVFTFTDPTDFSTYSRLGHDDDGALQPGSTDPFGTSSVTISAVAGTTYYLQVAWYDDVSGPPERSDLQLTWALAVPPPPPELTIDFVRARGASPVSSLNHQVLVPGYAVEVNLNTGSPTDLAQVVLPGGWSTTTFYNLGTSSFWFDLPPVSEGVGSGALVLVDTLGRTCSIDVEVLTPETSYRTAAPVTYDHVASGFGPSQASARSGSTPADAETGTINPDGGWGIAFGYSYDGTNYKLEQLGWRLDLSGSGYGRIEIHAIPQDIPGTPPTGLSYGEYLTQQEREQYPFGPTSDFSMGALIGDPVIDIGWQEFGFPDHRWSQYGISIYVPTAADVPLASGIPDPTVVQPESFFTSGRRAAHVTPGYNTSVGWGDDLETLANWDLISGAWHVGAGFVGNCMYLDGVGSARQKAATRPGAFAGGAYRMDGWIGGSVAGNSLRVGMEFYDQAGSLISTIWGSPYVVAPGDENLFNDTTWVSGTAPAGSWTRGLIFEFTSGTGQAFFDQVVFRTDSITYPYLATSFSLPSVDLIVDASGIGYALMYAVTDAQVALETAANPTENLRFGLTGATFTAAYQPVGWRYWLPAPFRPTFPPTDVLVGPLGWGAVRGPDKPFAQRHVGFGPNKKPTVYRSVGFSSRRGPDATMYP